MDKKPTNDSAIKKFFKENKSLTFMLPLLVILIIAAIIINLSSGKSKEATKNEPSASVSETNPPINTSQPDVDVLPKIIRTENNESVEQQKDPFESPMTLVGVVYSSKRSTAIIEWGAYSYIVELNDIVGNSEWKVTKIEKDNISLDNGKESIVLTLTKGGSNN